MTKKRLRLEREQYSYWQGKLQPQHPDLLSLLPNLAEKFVADQVTGRPYHGGLTKLVYWFLQGPQQEPLHPICLTVMPTVVRSSLSTTRTLSAILMQAQWQVLVRSLSDHRGVISDALLLPECPREFIRLHHSRPKTWLKDLAHCRTLLDKMTLNHKLKPVELLRSIQAQTEHLRYLIKP
jgi:hypothetical protein